jgi:hypothetical protein
MLQHLVTYANLVMPWLKFNEIQNNVFKHKHYFIYLFTFKVNAFHYI